MTPFSRFSILGVGVHAVDYTQAVTAVIAAAKNHVPFSVTALAVHGVMTGVDDAEQRARLNHFDLVAPDGQPVRWALNWLHRAKLQDRVYGPFLMLRLCEQAAYEKLRVFLYGSDSATLEALAQSLCSRFPGLIIAGTRPSRFRQATEDEWSEDVKAIKDSQTDLVFCGLGCPKQEVWVYEMHQYLTCPAVAIGAAFSFWSGRQKMAPRWMQRLGLEWLYRLSREPRRLWRRYLILNPRYVAGVVWQKLRPGSYPLSTYDDAPDLRWS
jgi:exopolysaccharide biosynthesis WecB/TagA/CpsF family protein